MRLFFLFAVAYSSFAQNFDFFIPDGASIDDPIDHVADTNISVTYGVSAAAYLSIRVDVPYITSQSSINGYPFCPSSYLIDFERPVSYETFTGDPVADGLGLATTNCAAHSFSFNESTFTFPDLDASSVTYEQPPTPVRCHASLAKSLWFCNTPVAWKVTIDEEVGRATYFSETTFNAIYNYAWACRNLKTQQRAVKVETFNVTINPNPGVWKNRTVVGSKYFWSMHVCQVGPYGPGCRYDLYGHTCVEYPTSFVATPKQVSSVQTVNVGCEGAPTGIGMTFAGFESTTTGCENPGHERGFIVFVLTNGTFTEPFLYEIITPDVLVTTSSNATTLHEYDLAVTGESPGLYRSGNTTLVYATECMNTELGLTERGRPDAFATLLDPTLIATSISFQFRVTVSDCESVLLSTVARSQFILPKDANENEGGTNCSHPTIPALNGLIIV